MEIWNKGVPFEKVYHPSDSGTLNIQGSLKSNNLSEYVEICICVGL